MTETIAKDIKLALKGIKESLDAKDYKAAIKQCKTVLKSDRNNYLALVFFGAALQETEHRDEAPKAFKKAIEVKPDNNLAWRGLASYYEKFPSADSNEDLLKAYERLIVLESESTKYEELIKKYEHLAVSLQDCVHSKKLYECLDSMAKDKVPLVKQCLLSVFLACTKSENEIHEYKKKLLSELSLTESPSKTDSTASKKYLELLYKEGSLHDVIREGCKIQTSYPSETDICEIICKAYAELYSSSDERLTDDLSCKQSYTALLEKKPTSHLGLLCKGISELELKDSLSAIDSLMQAVKEGPLYGLSWFTLCKCQMLLYQFVDSQQSANEALKCFTKDSNKSNDKLTSTCQLWLIKSLSEQDQSEDKWLEAVTLGSANYEQTRNEDVLPYLIKALIKLNKSQETEKYFNIVEKNMKFNVLAKYLKCFRLIYSGNVFEGKEALTCLVGECPECFEAWLELGKIHYDEGKGASCLSCLLRAAKLNQWCYLNFLYLGHCYKDLLNDKEKARRCYQKAFQLNPRSSETGKYLSDIYRILGKEELNGDLLKVITTQSPKSKWGWLNLGIHHLATSQYQEAINSLRVASRLDPLDRVVWEILADAYFYNGAYITAAKAYQKAIDLGSDSVYPHLQIALVSHRTKNYEASIVGFREIIAKDPRFLPALRGHAEVCLSLVKQYASQGLNGLAMDCCQGAINSLMKCLEIRKDLYCVWKLLGDVCIHFANLPDKYSRLTVSANLVTSRKLREGQTQVALTRMEILNLSSRSYCEALALNGSSHRLWYDLAVCYNTIAVHESSFEKRKEMRELASSAVKKSLLIDEKSWMSWNLYGVICTSPEVQDYPVAQHCFIRALEEKVANAVVWTNLATLYLCMGDLILANQAFTEAQRFDHDYVQAWIGQAMIANSMGHHDAMDLFRHANQLGIHPEGNLGYASLVCDTLLNTENKNDRNYIYSIKNMNAVTVATDALTWYTDKISNNPCAFNMLGLLLERQKRYRDSCKAFNTTVSLLLSMKKDGPEEDKYIDILDKALLNYGRSLKNIGKYEEAIEVLRMIRKANFVNQCAVAEANFRSRKYETAYSVYEATLEWLAPDSGFKSHILVAMAAVIYMHQGKEDAKVLLMQACQLKPPSVQGLFACCALGMLHSDLSLSELSLKELMQYRDGPKYLNHIAVFESYMYLLKGEKEKSIRAVCKAIHRHPTQASLWLSLSLLLLHLYPNFESQSAANCAEVTIRMGRSELDVSKVMSLVSLSDLLSGMGAKSLRSSQKAVHMFPYETENWVVLVASVLSRSLVNGSQRDITWLKSAITYVRRKFESSKAMTQWLSNNERKVTVMADALAA